MIPLDVQRKLLTRLTGRDVPNVIAVRTNTTGGESVPSMAAAAHASRANPSRGW